MPHESLHGFPVVLSLPVLWGDMDSFGHVNNVVYLRWCETARVEYLTRIGLWQLKAADGIGPILASISCDYRRAVAYPDTVHVGARVVGVGNSSFKMAHRIVSEGLNELAADLESTLVLYDYNRGNPVPLPAELRAAIEQLERG
jgi:acyl-CoA thioester hydrolase